MKVAPMLLPILACLGGVLTILSSCILLVPPFELSAASLGLASLKTTFLLLTYSAGAATSLTLALLIGGRVFAAMKRSTGAGELVRLAFGVLVLAAVAAMALGLDTHLLTRVSLVSTGGIGQKLFDAVHLVGAVRAAARAAGARPFSMRLRLHARAPWGMTMTVL